MPNFPPPLVFLAENLIGTQITGLQKFRYTFVLVSIIQSRDKYFQDFGRRLGTDQIREVLVNIQFRNCKSGKKNCVTKNKLIYVCFFLKV